MQPIAKKSLWISFLFWVVITSSCQNSNATKTVATIFPNRDYDKAIAYHYQGNNTTIIEKSKLNSSIKKQKELTSNQTRDFLQIINNKNTYGVENNTNFFFPKLGIVFYKNKKIVAHISICLESKQQKSTPSINTKKSPCYSTLGMKKLQLFCQELGFGQCS